jgi:NTE family protein
MSASAWAPMPSMSVRKSGELLFRQGERSDDVYFLLSGRLRAYTEEGGKRTILGEIGRGETVGELALFIDEPRSASIVALRNSALVKVTRRQVERAFAVSPKIALQMTRTIIERFRRSVAIIDPLEASPALETLADYIDDVEARSKAVYFVTDGMESDLTKLLPAAQRRGHASGGREAGSRPERGGTALSRRRCPGLGRAANPDVAA